MSQSKLEAVKQEMARVNTDISGITELKWMGMGEFNSNDHYIYYCGQESFTRNGVVLTVKKNKNKNKMLYLGAISKITELSMFVSKTNHSISQ